MSIMIKPKALSLIYFWLFLLLITTGSVMAQNAGVKTIHLVSGDFIPEKIEVSEVSFSKSDIFDGRYFKLIQFARIPDEIERKKWETAGLYLVDYLPDNTYFAVINQHFDLALISAEMLTIINVSEIFKTEPLLAERRKQGFSTDRLVVSYYASLNPQKLMSDLVSKGVIIEKHRDYSRQLDIIIKPDQLDEIIALPYIQFAGPQPDEPVLEGYDHRNSTGRSNYLNTGYNGLNYNGSGVVIAIGEYGTVDNLVDAKGRLTEMESSTPSSHKIGVMQNAGGGGNLDPTNRNNAWGATLLSTHYQAYETLITTYSARFFNHSYGWTISGGYDQTARDHDLRIASYPLHLVTYSSGNSGTSEGYAPYNFAGWGNITGQPKQNKNHFAIRNLNPNDDILDWGSTGPAYDGRIIPQLTIEGWEGTSDAAPKVVGLLAMLAQAYKDKNGGSEAPATLLRAILMNTADEMDDPGPDFKTGYGRPNLRRAYNVINNAQFITSSVSNGNTNSHSISVPANTKQVRVMLVWPDVAASVGANPAIVNNLNLVAKDPSLTSYNPWVLDHTANPTNLDAPPTRQVDNLNTIEQVTVDDPSSGNWTIEVNGANVPSGPQTYYLTYEFLMDELYISFPLKDHRFKSGDTYYLKWDSYGVSGTFTLDYQLDGGSWVNIVSGYSASSRSYQWTAPSVTGIHTIKIRVQRGALSSESDVCYIGPVPANLTLHWACGDGARIYWDAVNGATSYKVYRVGANYMEEVTTNITFDGASAILTGLSTTEAEYFGVSAVTGGNEGLRSATLTKSAGNYNCWNVKTDVANSVDKTNITLKGFVNPHNTTLTNVHFEYGPTTGYGSSSSNITISATGHTEEAVSSNTASTLSSSGTDVLHYRLVATSDGSPVYGDDQESHLPSGYALAFDGTDDCLNLSDHPNLPVYRSGTGTAYSISFWIKAPQATASSKVIYSESSSASGNPRLLLQTSGAYPNGMWIMIYDDNGTLRVNNSRSMQLLDNTWHHFAWVDANGTVRIYLDGNQSGSDIIYTPGSMTLNTASLGARFTTSASNFFPGTVDEISMWDKALSETEIRNLMHQSLQGDETNLKAYYRLDDGPAGRVFDVVNATEATIIGGGSKSFSTVPLGTSGTFVNTNSQTSIGSAGKQLQVTITSPAQPSTASYLGIYRTGDGNGAISTDNFGSSGATQRADIFWGIREFGTVTADLVIDYSTVAGISIPASIQLLKRTDASSAWTNVTADYVHNQSARTFSKTGETSFSEFSIGDGGDNSLPVMLSSFSARPGYGKITLTWVTESEVNTDAFILEKSLDSLNFTQFAEIPGQGNSSERNEYQFEDKDITVGTKYFYRLADRDYSGKITHHKTISVNIENLIPTKFALYPNFPNPFNPGTNIRFDLPANKDGKHQVQLNIYNLLGQKVFTLLDEYLEPGSHQRYWDGSNESRNQLASGIYILRMNAGEYTKTQKMVLMR